MKLLVTGASGFIGTHLVRVLREKHHVWTVERSGAACPGRIVADLSDAQGCAEAVQRGLDGHACDALIHLAARTATPETSQDLSILHDNLRMVDSAVRLVRSQKISKLIHFSSSSVYPNVTGEFSESAEIAPQKNSDCVYGLSKFCGEVLFEFLLSQDCPVRTHLRVSQVFGPGMPENRIRPTMERELRDRGTITVFGGGERTLNYITIQRLCDVVEECLIRDLPGVFNVSEKCLSLRALAEEVLAEGSGRGSIVTQPQGNRNQFRLATSRLDAVLNSPAALERNRRRAG